MRLGVDSFLFRSIHNMMAEVKYQGKISNAGVYDLNEFVHLNFPTGHLPLDDDENGKVGGNTDHDQGTLNSFTGEKTFTYTLKRGYPEGISTCP